MLGSDNEEEIEGFEFESIGKVASSNLYAIGGEISGNVAIEEEEEEEDEDEVVDTSDGVIVRCEYSSAEFSAVIIWFSPVRRISLLFFHITLPKKKLQLN